MRIATTAAILTIAIVCLTVSVEASGLYKWTDEDGNLHIATSLEDVPARYRDQVATMAADPPRPSPASPPKAASAAEPAPEATESLLPRFEIPYVNEGTTSRVIIQVTFNDRVTAPMAIDTGSPGMVISVDLAQRLGVSSRNSGTLFTEASGIGGSALAIKTIIDSVSVESARSEFVPTTVLGHLSTEFEGLIGLDFMANHTVSIDPANQVVIFQELPRQPDARGGHNENWWRATFEDFRSVRDLWGNLARKTNLREGSPYRSAIEFQAQEAKQLYLRLERYASEHAVPRHWR